MRWAGMDGMDRGRRSYLLDFYAVRLASFSGKPPSCEHEDRCSAHRPAHWPQLLRLEGRPRCQADSRLLPGKMDLAVDLFG